MGKLKLILHCFYSKNTFTYFVFSILVLKILFSIRGEHHSTTSSSYTCRSCHVHITQRSPVALTTSVGTSPGFSPACGRPVTGVSRQRWRSRSFRCSRPSVPSVTPTHRGACVSVGAPWRAWPTTPHPLRYQGLFFFNGKTKAHTLIDTFRAEKKTKQKNDPGHIRQLWGLTRKCSDGKAHIRLLQLWPTDKLLLCCSSGSLEKTHVSKTFSEVTLDINSLRHAGAHVRVL